MAHLTAGMQLSRAPSTSRAQFRASAPTTAAAFSGRRCSMPATVRPTRRLSVVALASRPDNEGAARAEPESDFDRETGRLALRMLTARAAAIVLQNIGQVDTFKAAWLKEYFQQHAPIEGNAFLAALYMAKPEYRADPRTGATHYINPAAIASAVLSTRESLARQLAKRLAGSVREENILIMRAHLEQHTYVSGSDDQARPSFRQDRRRGRGAQRQLQP